VKKNEAIAAKIEQYVRQMPPTETIAQAKVFLDAEREHIRKRDTNFGNLICDLLLDRFHNEADFAVYNGGGIRESIPAGEITTTMLESVFPFENTVSIVTVKGKDVLLMFEHSAAALPGPKDKGKVSSGAFLQVSKNIHVVYDVWKKPQQVDAEGTHILFQGERVSTLLIDGQELDPHKDYRIVTNRYLSNGGNGYIMLKGNPTINTYVIALQIISEGMKAMKEVSAFVDKRIIVRNAP
jgi:2',3'-cyclic-nucleotide 2'-phosphodiesterase (5'-nucleotidase family)